MSYATNIWKGLKILDECADGPCDVAAEHDVIYAGPTVKEVPKGKHAELDELGWFPDDEHDCWKRFV